jgi:hypothetical protein
MPQIITQDGATQTNTGVTSSMSIPNAGTMTIGANANRALVVCVQYFDAGTGRRTTGVNWNSGIQALTRRVQQVNGNWISEIWTLETPGAASSTVVVTFTGVVRVVAGALSYYNVRQNGGHFRGTASNTGTSAAPSVTIPSTAYDLVIDSMAADGGSSITATVGANQTQLWNLFRGTAFSAAVRGCTSTEPGQTSVTMSWSLNFSVQWATTAISLVPVASGARLPLMGAGR